MDGNILFRLPMGENDAGAKTIGAYFAALALAVWSEHEGFSGKRPFGNSGWKDDVYRALVGSGLVKGSFDEDGYLAECDSEMADKLIAGAIKEAFG